MVQEQHIHIWHRLLNVTREEWPRVLHGWSLRFFYQMGYIIGWTLITAMVVTHFGIQGLPYFYIFNGVLVILGTYVFSHLIHLVSHKVLILMTAGSAATLLSLALIFFGEESLVFFIMVLILASSIFSSQLHILLMSYVEEIFSPLEFQRVNPLIETAEPLGGVAAGLSFVLLIQWLRPEGFVYIWVLTLCALFPVYYGFRMRRRALPRLEGAAVVHHGSTIKQGIDYVRHVPFVRLLLVVIFLQWTFFYLLGYQYTAALNAAIGHGHTLLAHFGSRPLAYAEELTHGLGTFHLLFSLGMLLMQLFVSSRIVSRIGVVGAMVLLPFVSMFNSVWLLFHFGLWAAVLTKGVYEAMLAMYNNGYHNSYYAFYEGAREQIREVLEGGVRSFGMIMGTLMLIGFQFWFPLSQVPEFVSLMMIAVSGLMIVVLWRMRSHYTHVARSGLEYPGAHPEKFNAIEILTQRGHVEACDILTKTLLYKQEPPAVKVKILDALRRIKDIRSLPEVLTMLDDPNEQVKIAALDVIAAFEHLGDHFYSQAFTKQRVIDRLSTMFDGDHSLGVRSAIVRALASIHHPEVVQLLLSGLTTKSHRLQAEIISIMGTFKDSATAYYLEPYLEDAYPKTRANAIIALWRYKKYRLKLLPPLQEMLDSPDEEMLLSGIFVLGEIRAVQEIPRLRRLLYHAHASVQRYAAVSLAKLDQHEALPVLVRFLMHRQWEVADKTHRMVRGLSPKMTRLLRTLLLEHIHEHLKEQYGDVTEIAMEALSPAQLRRFLYYCELLDESAEAAKIHHILHERGTPVLA